MQSRRIGSYSLIDCLKQSALSNALIVLLTLLQTLQAIPYPPGHTDDSESDYRLPNDRYAKSDSDLSSLMDVRHNQERVHDGLKFPSRSPEGRKEAGFGGQQGGGGAAIKKGGDADRGDEDKTETETKYYYGGKFIGSCTVDGLYYRDDTTFIICSNGYPHAQPCPPGTRTAGYPRYKAGYYYGYTDLCSVNLVDYGYGPEYYAPMGYPQKRDDDESGGEEEGEKRGRKGYDSLSSSSSYSASQNLDKLNYDIVRQDTERKRQYTGGYGQTGQERALRKPEGRNVGNQSGLHYSNHLGSNKQGGAEYGRAKMADNNSDRQRENFGSSANRNSVPNDEHSAGRSAYKY